MTFYVIQVKTQKTGQFLEVAKKQLHESTVNILWPRRNLKIRKKGKWITELSPIFPGYLFLETDSITPEAFDTCRRIPGFIRFLKDNRHITPLTGRDKEIVIHFLKLGEVVGSSLATFDENQKVRILSGPLQGLEGRIVKVNKRKKRIKLKLELYENSFYIDFSFESIEKIKQE
jgi:transcriptional antiterminator NusG